MNDLWSSANNYDNEKQQRMLFGVNKALTDCPETDPLYSVLTNLREAILGEKTDQIVRLIEPYCQKV